MKRLFLFSLILSVFISIYSQIETDAAVYENIDFVLIKDIIRDPVSHSDSLSAIIDSLQMGWEDEYRQWTEYIRSDTSKSLLQIYFDIPVVEFFDDDAFYFINTVEKSILIPHTEQFHQVSKRNDKAPYNLVVKKQPVLYTLDKNQNSIQTVVGNYVIISLDYKSFRLSEMTAGTYFNRIYLKTDTVELSARLSGNIKYTDDIIIIEFDKIGRYSVDEQYWDLLDELNEKLISRGVPANWLEQNIDHELFKIYDSVVRYFTSMPEHQVSRGERNQDWYMAHFGVDDKVRRGADFRQEHLETLQAAESRTGIHYELILAIMAIESDYANPRWRGNFYTFGTLVSQYLLLPNRQRFAVNELKALYDFTKKTGKDTYHFIGSFAGATGWGQFIPTSLNSFFIDANDDFSDVDIYGIDDTMHSIGNYLNKAGKLSASNINNYQARYNAVHSYNKSDAYVKAVLYIYDNLYQER